MDKLIGKKINSVLISNDQTVLSFKTDVGKISYMTEGDCCSETWFADIIGLHALVGEVVRGVYINDMVRVDDGRSRREFDKVYGYTLTTDKGSTDIIFRNSSNGFYSGSIFLVEGNNKKYLKGLKMKQIVDDDWSA